MPKRKAIPRLKAQKLIDCARDANVACSAASMVAWQAQQDPVEERAEAAAQAVDRVWIVVAKLADDLEHALDLDGCYDDDEAGSDSPPDEDDVA